MYILEFAPLKARVGSVEPRNSPLLPFETRVDHDNDDADMNNMMITMLITTMKLILLMMMTLTINDTDDVNETDDRARTKVVQVKVVS